MTHRLFAYILLIVFSAATPVPYRAGAQTTTYVAYMGAWSSTTTYNLNEIVLSSGVDYISLSMNNLANPPATSPTKWIALGGDGDMSVKKFGAVGDGATDDTASLQSALTWMAANGRCLYFPAGAYKTTAELDWVNQYAGYRAKPLCLKGESWRASYIIYLGATSVDATIHVANTYPAQVMPAVDLRDIGIASNANATYAFHAITPGPSTMNNVAFAGGSVSSFEGDGWNGISDLRNLLVSPQFFSPAGSGPCVNGLTFSHGIEPVAGQDIPSSQFTLTAPLTVGCSGIGLNLANAMGITINGGQSSDNGQDMFRDNPGGQPQPVIFNGMLWERWTASPYSPPVLKGGNLILNGVQANSETEVDLYGTYGSQNVIESSTAVFKVESGAVNTHFLDSVIYTGSTDAGTGTYGSGNLQQAGGNAPPPWNSLPTLQVRYATVLPNGTDLYTIAACGIYSVANPVHGPAALAATENRVQVLCDQSASETSRTIIAQGIYDPTAVSNNITYINTESNGKWQGWQQFQLSGGLVTGDPTAPSGTCSVVGWMFSQDGHATFCNGRMWVPKI